MHYSHRSCVGVATRGAESYFSEENRGRCSNIKFHFRMHLDSGVNT